MAFILALHFNFLALKISLSKIDLNKQRKKFQKLSKTSQSFISSRAGKSFRTATDSANYPPELEAEIDRIYMCEQLVNILDQLYSKGLKPLFTVP